MYIYYQVKQSSEDTHFKFDMIDLCTSHAHKEKVYVCVHLCKPISLYVECNSSRAARPFWLKVQSAIHLTRGHNIR